MLIEYTFTGRPARRRRVSIKDTGVMYVSASSKNVPWVQRMRAASPVQIDHIIWTVTDYQPLFHNGKKPRK